MTNTLAVAELSIEYTQRGSTTRVIDGLSFAIAPGEAYGLVGESGSGKSTTALAIMNYLPRSGRIAAGDISFNGTSLLTRSADELRATRATSIAMVYQEPGRALNPTMRVGRQITDSYLAANGRLKRGSRVSSDTRTRVLDVLRTVGFTDPDGIARRYPHELSGGQQQRAMIAMAAIRDPILLILDEPTTGLDAQVEVAVLDLIDELRQRTGAATLFISHNLPLLAARCDRVGVLEHGRLVEEGPARAVLTAPTATYTRSLVDALPSGDRSTSAPEGASSAVAVATVTDFSKSYGTFRAVKHVSFALRLGEILGVVGESGSGKTTLGRGLAGLVSHEGVVELNAPDSIPHPVQMIFQSPDATLNPRRTVRQILDRAIHLRRGSLNAAELLERVDLSAEVLDRFSHELSGGQKQRVSIARAFAGPATIVVADEAVSALDASVQAKVLTLIERLQAETGVAILFISHDLDVVRQIADRVAVMYEGEIVELGPTKEILSSPQHGYTKALIEAARRSASRPTETLPERQAS
ncbi:ABC transporter ATP-binding protein [Herbiconiux sp. CPCC 205763]|uniref:ABC transporter ATP-binding protein n=1 Tax=Herbiconiux aconitum TaxID=2970913 RepID=A0ABT2GND6_9MICO|nr:ABC transporter ATP-binding protein [Herbiconiux aconitum]MCS5717730.1 ABC transporter ATP-binding protein [Herbiconiux aconitum]